MKHDKANTLTTLQARTAIEAVNRDATVIDSKDMIYSTAEKICASLIASFPAYYNETILPLMMSLVLAMCGRKAVKQGYITVSEYIAFLAEHKENNESDKNDFGAFGDLVEILARCALVKNLNLVQYSMLSVKGIFENDIVSKKYGVLEVGHNGKTLTFGNLFDYMQGDYNGIIYGVFDDYDKQTVYDYCKAQQIKQAVDFVAAYMVLWSDKYTFRTDMDNLSRGKGITVKPCGPQVVYNPSKYKAFQDAIEAGTFKTLSDIL